MIGLTGIAALEAEMRDRLADKNATISRLTAENEGLRAAAKDVLHAVDSDDVMGMRGDTVVLRVSFKSLMERLRYATTTADSDADGARG